MYFKYKCLWRQAVIAGVNSSWNITYPVHARFSGAGRQSWRPVTVFTKGYELLIKILRKSICTFGKMVVNAGQGFEHLATARLWHKCHWISNIWKHNFQITSSNTITFMTFFPMNHKHIRVWYHFIWKQWLLCLVYTYAHARTYWNARHIIYRTWLYNCTAYRLLYNRS